MWRAEAAKIGDLLLPAVAAPTAALGEIALLPGGQVVPALTRPAPAAGPRSLPIPAEATELEVTLGGGASLDPWQQLLLEKKVETSDDPGFELEQYEFPLRFSVTLSVRDAETGQGAVLEGPTLELPPNAVGRARPRFEGAHGEKTTKVALPAGRALFIDAVTVRIEGSTWVEYTTEVAVDIAAQGESLLGEGTKGWVGDAAVSEELAGPYRTQLADVVPEAGAHVEETDDMTFTSWHTNRPPTPSAFLDTTSSPWLLTTTSPEDEIRIGPTVAFDPTKDYDPLEVMKAAQAPTPSPAPVALTRRAAAEADLRTGDRIEVNAFGRRIPAVVSAVVDWVPSVTGDRALLFDSGALAETLSSPSPILTRPTEVWAAADGAPAAVADAVRAVPGVEDVAVASPAAVGGPTTAAADSLWLVAGSALALAVTGLAAAVSAQLTTRRPEVAVLRALGMTPVSQARSRAWETGGVLGIAAAVGMLAGWAISALVVGPLAWSAGSVELDAALRPELLPLAGILAAGAVAVGFVLAGLASSVRRQALDSEYRAEVR
ncbi:MAG: hypothetical protein IPJ61_17335 [Tessaracoccus sp.]|uniref:FtsX-like permease family protein n=1 Tax=Tessaracoccus sp. TaxID=1971211 RepID=UPI001ED6A1AD|nr:FtsX-like permease family protein [Tessaracoccus sp.]MBK7822774.1 hypothetical protein [Tessaracoccus sp.]